MTAFDIYVNNRKRCTVGIDEAGVVVAAMTWVAGTGKRGEDLEYRVGGLVSRTRTHVTWLHKELQVGDEVKLVVTSADKVDRPKEKRRESAAAQAKRERKYLTDRAAKLGLKLVKATVEDK